MDGKGHIQCLDESVVTTLNLRHAPVLVLITQMPSKLRMCCYRFDYSSQVFYLDLQIS
jgi:hypothetical protein